MADQPQLDWNAAQVSDGTLSVEVSGEFDDEWEQTLASHAGVAVQQRRVGLRRFQDGR